MAIETDVLICGSGSAGLCAATWLARLGISFEVIEKRDGPLQVGQADGIQCRTVEIFDSLDLAEELVKEAYWVNEVCFWSSEPGAQQQEPNRTDGGRRARIGRTRRTQDVAEGLSWRPHVILNQARLNMLLLEDIRRASGKEINYGIEVKHVQVDEDAPKEAHKPAVTVFAEKNGQDLEYRAKYVLGCDGAHSQVRKSLGFQMVGDTTDAVWGVMDIYPRTDFPDIRKKCTIRSNAGSLLIIPREGNSMVRFYIELPHGTTPKAVKLEHLQSTAKQIFSQYHIEFADTFWWSAYAIGQRLADHFAKDGRVFLTGDACHTHSPKAGQGMNVSLQDGFNIGWKLAEVLNGQAPTSLLDTYIFERRMTAASLIEFDRELTKLFSSKGTEGSADAAQKFSEYLIMSGRYIAGLTSKYLDSAITDAATSQQALATNVTVGMRFPSAQVVRFSDARAMQLARHLKADGRWRIVVFGGDIRKAEASDKLGKFAAYLSSKESPIVRFTPKSADIDSVIEPLLVLHGERLQMEQHMIPNIFWPVSGKYRMRDLHKTFFDDMSYNYGHGHCYRTLGVDPDKGAIVVVRPDQYVSKVTSIADFEGIGRFFRGFMVEQK